MLAAERDDGGFRPGRREERGRQLRHARATGRGGDAHTARCARPTVCHPHPGALVADLQHLHAAQLVELVHPVHVRVAHDAEHVRDTFRLEIARQPLVDLHAHSSIGYGKLLDSRLRGDDGTAGGAQVQYVDYAAAVQRSASRPENSPTMRFTTSFAPVSISEARRPEISTSEVIGITEPGGSACSTTLKFIFACTRVPPMLSLPFEMTAPDIVAGSSSSVKRASNLTLVGPNLTTRVASYDPSSCRSPSVAPDTHSTTARGSDNTPHTARGAADTTIRSLSSIMMPGL